MTPAMAPIAGRDNDDTNEPSRSGTRSTDRRAVRCSALVMPPSAPASAAPVAAHHASAPSSNSGFVNPAPTSVPTRITIAMTSRIA